MQKQNLKIFFLIIACLMFGGILSFQNFWLEKKIAKADGAVENLDELVLRKARQRINSYYTGEGVNYIWQPQALTYNDSITNHEVWKISSTPGSYSSYNMDIALNPWSADGKRLSYRLMMNDVLNVSTSAFTGENDRQVLMLVNPDGSFLRPIVNGPARVDEHIGWFPWSPILSDTYYMFGRGRINPGVNEDELYKTNVTNTGTSFSSLLDFNTGTQMHIHLNGLSQDGRKILAHEYWMSIPNYHQFPATIYPEGSIAIDDPDGYPSNVSHDGTYWGNTPETIDTFHSNQSSLLLFPDNKYWYIFMPSGSATIWKAMLSGSNIYGGPEHIVDHVAPYDFGEVWPLNARITGNNPFPASSYWSHGCSDRWGKYMLYSDATVYTPSPGLEDMTSHLIYKTSYGGGGVQHNDWHAWSDFFTSTRGPTLAGDYSADHLMVYKYDTDNSVEDVVYTHTFFNNGGTYAGSSYEYMSLPRPAQSPDGTKIVFHSTFLNSKSTAYDEATDIFWSTAYSPYPPEIKTVEKNGADVQLTWDFNQGTSQEPNHIDPRTYAKRGWPNEITDRPPSPREIKEFRVWSSDNNVTWTPIGTSSYNNCSGTNECGMWTETAWNFNATQANGTTKFYAVTSLEHSGLESKTLSNVWKVTTDGAGNIAENIQQEIYPIDPGLKSNFFTTSPDTPTLVSANHKEAPAAADGQYLIKWSAPINKSLIRYYNIYALDGSTPTAIQQRRIASIPATSDYENDGNFSYIDWLGNTDGSTQYKITSVDFQGNESGVVTNDLISPSAPSGFSVI